MRVIALTDDAGRLIEADWLEKAEAVHRQLRPLLPDDYAGKMGTVFGHGGRMCIVVEDGRVLGVAVWRVIENTADGRRLYVDDLVSDEACRSRGVGKAMLDWLEARARQGGCEVLALDSGVQRHRAHHFYFREGLHVSSFCFKKVFK